MSLASHIRDDIPLKEKVYQYFGMENRRVAAINEGEIEELAHGYPHVEIEASRIINQSFPQL